VTGDADFVVSVDSGIGFYYGSVGEAEIIISNKGSGPAEFVTVKASSDYGSKEFYIGSLDVDDSETIDLLQNLRGVSDSYPITLEISYRDKFQNSYSVTKIVEAMPTNAPADYTLLIIIVIAGGIGFWYYRKRKKK
jgi:LPXTG-motif cell wall-anchored protein